MTFRDVLQGKHGFVKKPTPKEGKAINVGDLARLLEKGKTVGEKVILDMASLGYEKVLGSGVAPPKIEVIASRWSKRAEEKLSAAGSTIKKRG